METLKMVMRQSKHAKMYDYALQIRNAKKSSRYLLEYILYLYSGYVPKYSVLKNISVHYCRCSNCIEYILGYLFKILNINPWTDTGTHICTDISRLILKQLTPSMLLSKHLKKKL